MRISAAFAAASVIYAFLLGLPDLNRANATDQKVFVSDKSDGVEILDFDFALATPGLAQDAAWSADGKKIAFSQFNGPLVKAGAGPWIIDAEHRSLSEIAADSGAQSAMAWSPNGEVLAFVPHKAEKLRFISLKDSSVVASWSGDNQGSRCGWVREVEFTASGEALWVRCRGSGAPDKTGRPILAALKITYPDFRIVDRIVLNPPNPGAYVTVGDIRFAKIDGRSYLVSLLGSGFGKAGDGRQLYRYYASAVPLDGNHEPIGQIEFEVDDQSGARRAPVWVDFSSDFANAIVLYGIDTGISQNAHLDRYFETYDVKASRRTLSFANQAALNCELRHAAVLPQWKYVVASAICRDGGGVIVFDIQTGAALQRRMLASARFLFMSPDKQRIAASAGSGMLFYKIRPNNR